MTKLEKIGIIHTPYEKDREIPHQAYKSEEVGEIEVFKKYEGALKDVEGFSHLIVLHEFHIPIKKSIKKDCYLKSKGLLVKPFLDNKIHGKFSTRSPDRPNPIGLSTVRLLKREENILLVKGVDILNGTPLLDLKTYVPKFDQRKNVKVGWYTGKFKREKL